MKKIFNKNNAILLGLSLATVSCGVLTEAEHRITTASYGEYDMLQEYHRLSNDLGNVALQSDDRRRGLKPIEGCGLFDGRKVTFVINPLVSGIEPEFRHFCQKLNLDGSTEKLRQIRD